MAISIHRQDFVMNVRSTATAFSYDSRGRRTGVDAADTLDAGGNTLANVTTTSDSPDSQLQETTGAQTYRVSHTYDYAGRLETMTTYGTATATTTWTYSFVGRMAFSTRLLSISIRPSVR